MKHVPGFCSNCQTCQVMNGAARHGERHLRWRLIYLHKKWTWYKFPKEKKR